MINNMSDSNEKMIAYCGLICTECPAYEATKLNDLKKIEEVAALCSKEYNIEVKPESVWCDGCLVEGKKCDHCGRCEVRACAIKKELNNCGYCADYPCNILTDFFKMAPADVKDTLDTISQNLKSKKHH